MRQLKPPDWSYFSVAWGIVAVGLGMVVMSGFESSGIWLMVLGSLLLVFSLRPTLRSLFKARSLDGPCVVLHGQDAFHVKRVSWPFGQTDVLSMRFINAPRERTENAVAKGLGVEFTCEGADRALPWLQARDDYSPQPSELKPGERPQLIFDLGIDKWKEVNLVIKEPDSDYCYLFNNDSYHYPRAQNPEWRISPGEYRIVARISGTEVREQFECLFLNSGRGMPLEVKTFKHLG